MGAKIKSCSKSLISTAVLLFLIIFSSTESVSSAQGNLTEGQYAYVPNEESNDVFVINTETNAVIATVNVGIDPVGVAISPDGSKVYVTNADSNNVSVIDTATNTLTATVDVGQDPFGIAINPDGSNAYVTNYGDNTVSVINTETNTIIATVNVENGPYGIVVSPNGSKIYVTNRGSNTITVIDTPLNTVIARVNVGSHPYGAAVTPDGTKLYVTNWQNNTVSIIATATNTVIATVPVGSEPHGIAVNPAGTKVYVANHKKLNGTVSVIDTATSTVTATVNVGIDPVGVAVTPDGKKAYVTNYGGNNVFIIDTATDTITDTIPVGIGPSALGQFIGYIPMQDQILPIVDFSVNVTSGYAPLSVLFTNLSQNVVSWSWDFENDGNIDSTDKNPVHTYMIPGNYTANLTVSNEDGTASKTQEIFVQDAQHEDKILPFANFTTNVTSGNAPLLVQFTDLSQNATSRNWNFGDGATSTEQNPMHTYSATGTYIVSLTTTNEKGTSPEKITTITVTQQSSPDDGDNGGGSHKSSGGGGGSPEPARNVQVKEISRTYVASGKPAKFDFAKNATCVVYVSFDAKKTAGKTTTIAEQLKGKSTLVSNLSTDEIYSEVYKYFNLWVGNAEFATEKNIENPVVCFKVEKSWLQDKRIDQNSVTLNRYSNRRWSQLPVKLLKEDNKYLYFTAETSEFSFFAITGTSKSTPKNITNGENITTFVFKEETNISEPDTLPIRSQNESRHSRLVTFIAKSVFENPIFSGTVATVIGGIILLIIEKKKLP